MKRLTRRLAGLLATGVLAGCLALFGGAAYADEPAQNLLTDGGFESSTLWDDGVWTMAPEWWGTGSDEVTLGQKTDYVTEGSQALGFWTKWAQTMKATQDVELQPGTYVLSGKAKAGASTPSWWL
ncbi:MAG: hypothetical protein Q4D06_02395 [Coriobacteriia bacterium]|nr:hypothetical protein [Coriobacteriia bacterium]